MAAGRTDTPAGEVAADRPPDPAAVYREVARLVAFLCPQATNVRILFDAPDGCGGTVPGRLAVPTAADPADDLGAAVLAELGKLRAGEWLGGKALAAALDCDREAGNFRRTLARLSKPGGPVESNQRNGYRLRQ
jgi:biotin operon repressor